MILAIRTDNPEAELVLCSADKILEKLSWTADRKLSEDIHIKIEEILSRQNISYQQLSGLIFYKGPGSFTGLRIGASVANTLASELDKPIVGTNGEDWIASGLDLLKASPEDRIIVPAYGAEAKTTKPKK